MWNNLTQEQKIKFREYCDAKYGETIVFCETGEPMYMDEQYNLIDTGIVVKLLFSVCKN